jgi:GMP synthase-like glutamine amidotransferase
MNIHYFQHVPFEGLGIIEGWIRNNHHNLMGTKFYSDFELPDINTIDALIVMGGPMGVYDDIDYYWLKYEKDFIEQAIKQNKKVIGICLGAQLIAYCLGARVFKNQYKEIGWYPVKKSTADNSDELFNLFPDGINVLHWHGDTFDLSRNAKQIYSSEACKNQGFFYKDNVIALQFHLESTIDSVKTMISNCGEEIKAEKYIQPEKEILENTIRYELDANKLLFSVLKNFLK